MKRKPLRRKSRLRPISKKKRSRVLRDGREVLNSADWAIRRIEVFNRDDGACQKCGFLMWDVSEAEIHHITKRSIERNDAMENLQTLCSDCHFKHHQENP